MRRRSESLHRKLSPAVRLALGTVGAFLVAFGACSEDRPAKEVVGMKLTSKTFIEGDTIPTEHTCDGPDLSPPLQWGDPPERTQSFALSCVDPDAPAGTWVHWVLFNLPPGLRGLPAGVRSSNLPAGASEGTNDFRRLGYGGPCPPPGPAHRYYFTLYALDTTLAIPKGARLDGLQRAMEGHILEQGRLMGRYARKR